jgi:hypothetical protein
LVQQAESIDPDAESQDVTALESNNNNHNNTTVETVPTTEEVQENEVNDEEMKLEDVGSEKH